MLDRPGAFPAISLAKARQRAEARQLKLDRIDAGNAVKAAQKNEADIDAHRAGWKTRQRRSSLSRYVNQALGSLPVGAIDTGLVMKCIAPHSGRRCGRIDSIAVCENPAS